ncbi:hypothetical protein [Fructilactobacillus florum]|uniref:Uncharacterized protein n=1 Tax=Fructilactobacillus florum DSM 22689 = JCM 16035 TaxID=1423745 RepID=A0A0R2CJ74_9LACO|nr:hypothetical protein [Fructilactobacillus florum]KRM91695.1 hypothetical protein FC87_GL000832 [Fructilactobacillus florum DSM 22689 = JCM 16035]
MELGNFNLATGDLNPNLKLFVHTKTGLQPVTNLLLINQQLCLASHASNKPLTLDQFNTRTKKLSPKLPLKTAAQPPQMLFGFRRAANQIILG